MAFVGLSGGVGSPRHSQREGGFDVAGLGCSGAGATNELTECNGRFAAASLLPCTGQRAWARVRVHACEGRCDGAVALA